MKEAGTVAGQGTARRAGRLRAALTRAALVAGSVALACGVGEIATRLLFPPVRGISWYHNDPRYEFKHRPNVDQQTTEWGERTLWRFRTNSRGFRWPEWPDAPAAGTSRVLVMGDSFTFANAVETEQAFPSVADAALRARGPWEVINAGVSAWGPENALAYLETEGEPIRASCLVYAFYEGNDVTDAGVHPLYELKDGRLTRIQKPQGVKTPRERIRDVMRALPMYDLLLAHSQLFNMARNAFLYKVTWKAARASAAQQNGESPEAPGPELFETMVAPTLATLDRLAALGRERFGAFALLMIPLRERALLPPGAQPAGRTPEWVALNAHERVVAWAKDHAVPVIDAGEQFPKDPAAIKALYFNVDFHMSVAGNRFLGGLLAERAQSVCAKR